MRIVNKTRYATKELRAIACAVNRETSRTEGQMPHWSRLVLTVVYGRTGYTGHAWGARARICLPKREARVREMALVIDHEFHHCRGFGHDKFCTASHDKRPHSLWDWAVERFGPTITERPVERPAKPGRAERYKKKIEALWARMTKREARVKRDQAALKRYAVRLAYLKRKAAEPSPTAPSPTAPCTRTSPKIRPLCEGLAEKTGIQSAGSSFQEDLR